MEFLTAMSGTAAGFFSALLTFLVVLTIVVICFSVANVIKALRSSEVVDHEDDRVESRMFAPAGFLPTPAERELQQRWDAVPDEHKHTATGH